MSIANQYLKQLQKDEALGSDLRLSREDFEKVAKDNPVVHDALMQIPLEYRDAFIERWLCDMNENPFAAFDSHLGHLKVQFLTFVESSLRQRLEEIPVGSLRTFDVNAWTMPAPDGTPIIVFHYGLMGFVQDIARIIAAISGLLGQTKIDGHEFVNHNLDELAYKGTLACLTFLCGHQIKGDRFIRLSRPQDLFMASIRDDIELFILAHEYGHIALNHHSDPNLSKSIPASPEMKHVYYRRSPEVEFEADWWAAERLQAIPARWMVTGQASQRTKYAAAGGVAAVTAMLFLEKIADNFDLIVNNLGIQDMALNIAQRTHPPTEIRRAKIKMLLSSIARSECIAFASGLEKFFRLLSARVDSLFRL